MIDLDNIRRLLGVDENPGDDEHHDDELAAAALMMEMAMADRSLTSEEMQTMESVLVAMLDVDPQRAVALIERARDVVEDAVSLHEFTSRIARNSPPERRISIIEAVWKVAYADGEVDKYEQHLIRKLKSLLHVPQSDYIQAKMRARESTGT